MKVLVYRSNGIEVIEAESIEIQDREYDRRLDVGGYYEGAWRVIEHSLRGVLKIEVLF